MGGLAMCCIGNAACCAGQACCKCLCVACEKAGVAGKNFSKIGYVVLQILNMTLSIVVLFTARPLVDKFPNSMISCPN